MLAIYLSSSLAVFFIVFIVCHCFSKNRKLMKELKVSEGNCRELVKKFKFEKQELQTRIQEEIERCRQKDLLVIRDSKFAALGEIISNMEHEWRQPLNSLSLLVQDVKEARAFGEIDDLYIDRFINESMFQIQQLSQTVIDFRKFYQFNGERNAFSVEDSIEVALALFSSSLKSHKIYVEFEYRGQHIGYGFSNDFSHVIFCILTNARDAFIDNNIKNRKFIIQLDESGNFITVKLLDNAGVIDTDHLQFMARIILDRMDGRISVETTSEGTRLCLQLPKACTEMAPAVATI